MLKVVTAALSIAAMAAQVSAAGAAGKLTFLKSAKELPLAVIAKLKDCPYLNPTAEDAPTEPDVWKPDGETGGSRLRLAKGGDIYVVSCDLAASNVWTAAVLHKNGKAKRLSFPFIDEVGKKSMRTSLGNAHWKNGILESGVAEGCAGNNSTTASHAWAKDRFELSLLEVSRADSNCENAKTKVIYKRKK
jgi:hypothetical protein